MLYSVIVIHNITARRRLGFGALTCTKYNKSGDLYNKIGGFFAKHFHKSIFRWYALEKWRKQYECVCIPDKSEWSGDPDCS